jgi:hypothetical protein
MKSESERKEDANSELSGVNWVAKLMERQVIPGFGYIGDDAGHFGMFYNLRSRMGPRIFSLDYPTNTDECADETETELDAYSQFLSSTAAQPPTSTQSSNAEPSTTESSSIVSTLTTTQRTTNADGSVHTKITLKKRFADGRETSTETEHTMHPSKTDTSRTGSVTHSKPVEAEIKKALREKKGGWFWSE